MPKKKSKKSKKGGNKSNKSNKSKNKNGKKSSKNTNNITNNMEQMRKNAMESILMNQNNSEFANMFNGFNPNMGSGMNMNDLLKQYNFTENNNSNESNNNNNNNTESNKKLEIIKEEYKECLEDDNYVYKMYSNENQMTTIQELCAANLSEPYSVFTYRYFVINWPELCYFAHDKHNNNKCVGLIISELKMKNNIYQGYIAMLVVDKSQRRKGLGTKLVELSVNKMKYKNADKCILETELSNKGALQLYKKLGFIRDKYYKNYYLNGSDAYRLSLFLK